mmetsp:Transcript_11718/g.17658  ORF Transcript_11718/g.17658 Transcript_11718/m.17658 type:complete len:111 (+) Transcript_11718:142-474(+)
MGRSLLLSLVVLLSCSCAVDANAWSWPWSRTQDDDSSLGKFLSTASPTGNAFAENTTGPATSFNQGDSSHQAQMQGVIDVTLSSELQTAPGKVSQKRAAAAHVQLTPGDA